MARQLTSGRWVILALFLILLLLQTVPLYIDWLWFNEVGYQELFVKILSLRGWLVLGVGFAVFLFMWANLRVAVRSSPPDVLWELEDQLGLPGRAVLEPLIRRLLIPVLGVIGLISGIQASSRWEALLLFLNARGFQAADPLFGRDIGFYVFKLPFYNLLYGWGMFLVVVTLLLSLLVYVLQRSLVMTPNGLRLAGRARAHLLVLAALLLGLKSVAFYLDRFGLLFSSRGIVYGATYTDINASLPVLTGLSVLALLVGLACLWQIRVKGWRVVASGLAALAVAWVGGLAVYPSIVQRFSVAPNELVAEGPFITHNIRMTRDAYGLGKIEQRPFPAEENLRSQDLDRNRPTVDNIRLWDHRPLLTTFGQLQEIRTYYKFLDVDNDRYWVDGKYRQVMLSPRELSYRHLPSQIWINSHLTYTHGYGVVLGPVNRISPEGLPEFFIKDIPPVSTTNIKVSRPEIYYGEFGNEYVFVRTRSQELDYPSGEQNVYATYKGNGGIQVGSFLRKVLFAMRQAELKILLSNDITSESRIMIYRSIAERVRRIAPFLLFDRDPYLVVTDDGRLVWMIDAYTTTDGYPYSTPMAGGENYIRNSVKATVDAYHGSVNFYVADPTDPVIQAYSGAFPALFKPLSGMPADLRSHIRYPEDLFTVQSRMYSTYHMEDPQVFYNKEDLWQIPRKAVEGRDREMEPYYTIMRLPGETKEEFVLLMLFTPSRKDNMSALLVARADPPNYGRLIVYDFPKQKLIYGPRQIEARIDQDAVISQQLTLWSQAGSTVIRGSLLAFPIERSLIYVEPLYLAAAAGQLPELKRVIVAYGNRISMEVNLETALQSIFGRSLRTDEQAITRSRAEPSAPDSNLRPLIGQAWEQWARAQDALRRGDWAAYGEAQRRLEALLKELRDRTGR